MAQAVTTAGRAPAAVAAERVRLRWRDELVTVVLGTWLMIGLFVDGWAHNNLAGLETFFTPWHALFYSGFAATSAWIAWRVIHAQDSGRRGWAAVPLGYGLALAGCVVFAVGGAADAVWHTVFGIEQDLEALFSPTHLLLFSGILLILSAPLRAAWAADEPEAAPRYRDFLPTLLSATLATTLMAFMFMFFAAFWYPGASAEAGGGYSATIDTLSSIFATNLILVAPLLLMARRWSLPFGTATTLIATVAALTSALGEVESPALVGSAVVAGLAADVLLHALRPSTARPAAYWAAGAGIPLLIWSAWFAATAIFEGGIAWTAEMWSGAILWSAILGGILAVLMLPPKVPRAA